MLKDCEVQGDSELRLAVAELNRCLLASRARIGPYWRDSLSMSLAVGVIGVTFGVCADAAGFSLPRIMAMSVFVFAGQFAVVGVIDSGGAAAAAVGALLLASRNALYGPVVRQFLPLSLLGRITGAHFVSDQSTAIAVHRPTGVTHRAPSGSPA